MAAFATKKRRQDYALICVTADDTYHNLTVTAPSSSDYAYERTLTSVSFYPTETYYIMNYKAMYDQQMTATNTVQPRWFLALLLGRRNDRGMTEKRPGHHDQDVSLSKCKICYILFCFYIIFQSVLFCSQAVAVLHRAPWL